jgi:hypothetical protein
MSSPVLAVSLLGAAAGGFVARDIVKGPQMIVNVIYDPHTTSPQQYPPFTQIIPRNHAFQYDNQVTPRPTLIPNWIDRRGQFGEGEAIPFDGETPGQVGADDKPLPEGQLSPEARRSLLQQSDLRNREF